MSKTITKILLDFEKDMKKLESRVAISRAVDKLRNTDAEVTVVSKILSLIEKYPDYDWGTPGGFAHYMETFKKQGYEDLLIESFLRKPTENTAYQLFRQAFEGADRKMYVALFKTALTLIEDGQLEEHVNEYIHWLK